MLLRTLILSCCLLGAAPAFAQTPKIERSESMDIKGYGWYKILQLKNGNTVLMHFSKDGIHARVFGKDRKLISERVSTGKEWVDNKIPQSTMEGIYEINGKPVIFLSQVLQNTPHLFRIVLDPATGAVQEEKLLGTLPKYKALAAFAIQYGDRQLSEFRIEKDPNSDCYAVGFFDGFADRGNDRIGIIHYDGAHKELSRANYVVDDANLRFINLIGMVVDADKRLFVTTYGSNSQNSGRDGRVIISRLNKGDNSFKHRQLEFTEDFRNTDAVMQYNAGNNTLQLMTLTTVQNRARKTLLLPMITFLDPENLYVKSSKILAAEKVDQYVAGNFHDKQEKVSLLPQNMYINADNSTTVVLEGMDYRTTTNAQGRVVKQQTFLHNIGVLDLNESGEEQRGIAMRKEQMTLGLMKPMYLSAKGKGMWSYNKGNTFGTDIKAYLSFDYINTATGGRYVVYNDHRKNFERSQSDAKFTTLFQENDLNTYYYSIVNGVPRKQYLFGNPTESWQRAYCNIEASDYQASSGTYATILVEWGSKKEKLERIAWVTFQ